MTTITSRLSGFEGWTEWLGLVHQAESQHGNPESTSAWYNKNERLSDIIWN